MADHPKDLVSRTFLFAKRVRQFVNRLPRTTSNYEDSRQLVRSSGSVSANYLEAQEGVSRKDFFYRIRICRKEARESGLWLKLVECGADQALGRDQQELLREADELKRIFQSIVNKDDTGAAAQ